MRRLILSLALSLWAWPVAAEPPSEPAEMIAKIYDAYQAAAGGPDLGQVYSSRLQGLIDADKLATPEGEAGRLDWDVFVDGNDWTITGLKVTPVSEEAEHAQVRASFKNHSEPREILFDLVREDGRWLVDDVQSVRQGGRWTMSKILTGAPDAFPDAGE